MTRCDHAAPYERRVELFKNAPAEVIEWMAEDHVRTWVTSPWCVNGEAIVTITLHLIDDGPTITYHVCGSCSVVVAQLARAFQESLALPQ